MNREEEILNKIIKKVGVERREEIENKINQLIADNHRLTRLGALYLICEELGVFESIDKDEYIVPIAKLVGGLNNVNIRCKVLGIRGPIKTATTEYAFLRLGDNSGVVSAIAWSESLKKMLEMNIAVGDDLIIKDAYTRDGIDGRIELHIGKNAYIKKIDVPKIQTLENFFQEDIKSNKPENELDIKARIIGLSDEFFIDYRNEKVVLREVLLLIGDKILNMNVWRDQIDLIKNAELGQLVLIAAAKIEGQKLIVTPKTCITFLNNYNDKYMPPLNITVLDRLELSIDENICLATCFNQIIFVKHPDIEPANSYVVRKYEFVYKDKKWILIPYELGEKIGSMISNDIFVRSLSELSEELTYVCIDGIIEMKSPLALHRLKNDKEIEVLNLWLTDGKRNVYCRAFGANAKIINNIPEGNKVRLKWVKLRKTKFGDLEIIINDTSKVEAAKED